MKRAIWRSKSRTNWWNNTLKMARFSQKEIWRVQSFYVYHVKAKRWQAYWVAIWGYSATTWEHQKDSAHIKCGTFSDRAIVKRPLSFTLACFRYLYKVHTISQDLITLSLRIVQLLSSWITTRWNFYKEPAFADPLRPMGTTGLNYFSLSSLFLLPFFIISLFMNFNSPLSGNNGVFK